MRICLSLKTISLLFITLYKVCLQKIDQIQIELSHFDVIALSETWLKPSIEDIDIKLLNYQQPFRKDRQNNNYGGVIVYVRDNIPCKRRHDLELQGLESIWLEFKLKRKIILFGLFYRPPNSSQDVDDKIEQSLDLASDNDVSDILITGDFNLNYFANVGRNKVQALFSQYNLFQVINEPTHFSETSSSLIDLLFTKDPSNILLSGVGEAFLEQNIRYHCPIYVILRYDKHKHECFKRKIWKYDNGNFELLKQYILDFDWHSLIHDDINIYAENFTNKVLELCGKTIPNKMITVRPSDPPWFNSTIRKSIRKRKRAHKRAKRENTAILWGKFRKIRNETVNLVKRAKRDLDDKIAAKLKSDSISSKDWWRTFKTLIRKDKLDPIPPLIYNDCLIHDATEKANIFNKHFQLQSTLDDTDKSIPILTVPVHSLASIFVENDEVSLILKSLTTGKACGPDEINNKVLKEVADVISPPLTDLYNYSLKCSSVPDIWKKANVTPVHKKDDKTQVENYRPISLLSTLGKILEKVIHKHIHNYLLENRTITPFQSGFTSGDSTVNQLVSLYNTFNQALDEGKEVRAVFCDISKAFDRVWHQGLLAKLKHYGISGSLLSWFRNYLSNRYQRVVIPGGQSEWQQINAGVPQGSILGPLLFILYINDIVHEIHSDIRLFADDTSLYIIVDFPESAAQILNLDLERISNWAGRWLVSFNPQKTETLLFTRKINRINHPTLYFNDVPIQEVSTHKHLGLYFSQRCDWQTHIDYIVGKAWCRMNLLRQLKFKLDRKSLEKMYFTFIRSLLEYADVAWDNCTQQQSYALEKIQLEAGRIVTGTTKLVEINKLYTELGWVKLSDRRSLHKLFLFFKMVNGLTPNYLSNLVPPRVGDVSSYSLRNSEQYVTINANTHSYAESFLPSAIQAWNNLPAFIKSANTVLEFKRLLTNHTQKIPDFYYTGDRLSQILHTRLRTECSSLKQHLFHRNLVPNPNCICGEVESNNHFLLECPRYNLLREDLLSDVRQLILPASTITSRLLLYGDSTLSVENNCSIFKEVQKYIKKSKRFVS